MIYSYRYPYILKGGASYSPEFQAVVDYAALQGYADISGAQKANLDALVTAYVAVGLWNTLDVLYIDAVEDSDWANINYINPGTFTKTTVNAPVFTANKGWAGDGVSGYMSTNYTLGTSSTNWLDDDAGIGCHLHADSVSSGYMLGSSGNNLRIRAVSVHQHQCSQLSPLYSIAPGQTAQYHKTGATTARHYQDATNGDLAVTDGSSTGVVQYHKLASNYDATLISMAFIGADLHTDGTADDLYTEFGTYLATL